MNKLITFEGGEGTGKSTQAKLLLSSFKKITKNIILTREPGGTINSELVRDILVKKQNKEWKPLSELLLINAARYEHINKLINPSLKKKVVICDRFIDSTIVYQVYAKGIDKKIFNFLNKLVTNGLKPQITFLIDLNPKKGLKRTLSRKNNEDRYENYNIQFHYKVREAFLSVAKKNKKRIVVLDGNLSKEQLHRQIIKNINKLSFFKKKLPFIIE